MHSADPIQLDSQCGIRAAKEHHGVLLGAFREREEIEIDAAKVEHVDVAFLQLLVSAAKTAAAKQKRMRLTAVSQPLRAALTRAGLRLSSSDDQITWARG
jgi:phospholipid transport system transporter-binding protein